jgi:hypothetical protein
MGVPPRAKKLSANGNFGAGILPGQGISPLLDLDVISKAFRDLPFWNWAAIRRLENKRHRGD